MYTHLNRLFALRLSRKFLTADQQKKENILHISYHIFVLVFGLVLYFSIFKIQEENLVVDHKKYLRNQKGIYYFQFIVRFHALRRFCK